MALPGLLGNIRKYQGRKYKLVRKNEGAFMFRDEVAGGDIDVDGDAEAGGTISSGSGDVIFEKLVDGAEAEMEMESLREGLTQRQRRNYCNDNIVLGWTVLVLFILGLSGMLFSYTQHRTSIDPVINLSTADLPPYTSTSTSNSTSTTNTTTSNLPPLRHEWRTLSPTQQTHYITSVLCLLKHPSPFPALSSPPLNLTLYDTFPYIHSHIGYTTHNSAAFLPWHRYFLHLYETALREKCGYEEGLVYWDWTRDWEDLSDASVFEKVEGGLMTGQDNDKEGGGVGTYEGKKSMEIGFGGDGDKTPNAPITAGKTGRCLTTGSFKNITVHYNDVLYAPHCLSRGFISDTGVLGHIDGTGVSPTSMTAVMRETTYDAFVTKMESVVHDTIPFGIGGDFWTFTAPYDPLFWLHHTMLDRVWWLWQRGLGIDFRGVEEGDCEGVVEGGCEGVSGKGTVSAEEEDEQIGQGKQGNGNGNGSGRIFAYEGHKGRHSVEMASLEDELGYMGFGANVKVREVMDTGGGEGGLNLLNYRY